MRKEIREKIDLLKKEFEKNFPKAVDSVPFDFDVKVTVSGQAGGYYNPSRNLINLNKVLWKERKEDVLNDILPHEVAHYIVDKLYPFARPHGKEWKIIFKGITGKKKNFQNS